VAYFKRAFAEANPRSDEEAKGMSTLVLCQRTFPSPLTVKDGVKGTIASLCCALFENAAVIHGTLVVKWMVQHLIASLGTRPSPDAAMEYCVRTSVQHANAYCVVMRWCTVEQGQRRYGEEPFPCRKLEHPVYA